MRRIFISHSTNTADAQATQYISDFVDGLADVKDGVAPRFRLFFDRRSLQGGDDWKLKITNHLVYCDAAVIVLSERALTSTFVQHEVSNLMSRRTRQRDPQTGAPLFDVIPVIPWIEPSGVSRQAFARTIADSLQQGFWKSIGFANDVNYIGPFTAGEALEAVQKKLGEGRTVSTDPAMSRLEKDIARYLEKVDEDAFDAAAQAAGFEAPPPGVTKKEASETVAAALLTCSLEQQYAALDEMRANLGDDLVKVFELLSPSWVSHEAAIALAKPLSSRPPGCCPIVNGTLTAFTPRMYVQRARGRIARAAAKMLQVADSNFAGHASEDLRRRVLATFRDQLPLQGDIDSPAYVKALEKELTARPAAIPIVVAVALASEASLPALVALSKTKELSSVLFFGLCGETLLDVTDPAVLCLKPVLYADQESHVYTQHNSILESL